MTENAVERVAELLAKIGGTWSPERANGPRKPVTSRQRDVARLILAELERIEAAKQSNALVVNSPMKGAVRDTQNEHTFSTGEMVEYCPPGDKRSVTCRIEKLDGDRAYLVAAGREVGWVSTHTFLSLKS